ncbi:MAG: archaeal heat shock protein Hsp20 [Promethearchaeati archaeon SRVP18_Atabeyarchaeia-1]
MFDDDWWERWFRKGMPPFFKGWDTDEMDEAFEEMDKMFEDIMRKAPKDLIRERRLPDGTMRQEWGPFVYGYSITIGPDGKPEIREFGNMKPELSPKPGRPRLDVKKAREPLVDVTMTDGEVKVIAELPGVEKDDIKLAATEDELTILVDNPIRKYQKAIDLPTEVNPKQLKWTYKNGILEVTLPKKGGEVPSGKPRLV